MKMDNWKVDEPLPYEPYCFQSGSCVYVDFGAKDFSKRGRDFLKQLFGKIRKRPDVTFITYTNIGMKDMLPPPNMSVFLVKDVDMVKYKIQLC